MASITDCVSEGLKYPFTDPKKLLSFGAIFAVLNVISLFISTKSMDITRVFVREIERTNSTALSLNITQVPTNDIYIVIALSIVSFIIALFVMGYLYDVIKFAIDKKEDLPGFNDIAKIFVNGIKMLLVTVAYYIIPFAVFVLGIVFGGDSPALGIVILISAI